MDNKLSPLSYKDLKNNSSNKYLHQLLPVQELLLIQPELYKELSTSGVLTKASQARILYLQDPVSKSFGGCLLRRHAPELNSSAVSDTIFASHIFFELDADSCVHEDGEAFEQLTATFYSELLIAKLRYGLERGCNILTIQSVDEHHDSKLFGNWNYRSSYLINETQVLSHLGSAFEQMNFHKASA
jgi:hypothetical protein